MTYYDASTNSEFSGECFVLEELLWRAAECEIQILVVGAVARNFLIQGALGVEIERKTTDVDIAVMVDTWEHLQCLTKDLEPVRQSPHKYRVLGLEVDIVPFGPVEQQDRTITWPNDHKMNVLGFDEALATSVEVRISKQNTVRVASLPAQVVLKILAWQDRRLLLDERDAVDLKEIISAYEIGPHLDALYHDHVSILEFYDFDPALASAHRIGLEASSSMGEQPRDQVIQVLLQNGGDEGRLAVHMRGNIAANRETLNALLAGLRTHAP